jgi:outer membrane protein OmpA-like peptidoglycan-associated protein
MNDKWEFYNDASTKWRWRRTAPNGNIVGASTEGYSNKIDCEANARRNGWIDDNGAAAVTDTMTQKEIKDEQKELRNKAFALYKEQGFIDGTDFFTWLDTERTLGASQRKKHHAQVRGLLAAVVALLSLIAVILAMQLFKKTVPVTLSDKSLSALKVMMVVIDPKEDEKVVVFGDTHFDFDESALSNEAKMLLDYDVKSLKENPNMHVRMAGYTSAKGSDDVNQHLSEQRANSVRNYLIEQGIAPERISVIGYGRTKPALFEVTPGDNESKEALANMRVLFEIVVK